MDGPAAADVTTVSSITNTFPEKNAHAPQLFQIIQRLCRTAQLGAILSVKQTGIGRVGLRALLDAE